MPLDFQSDALPFEDGTLFGWDDQVQHQADLVRREKSLAAQARYFSGLQAEDSVARAYESRGAQLLQRRWRGKSGEIDLIFAQGADVIFVEVKASKTHDRAAARLSHRQLARVSGAALEYLETQPKGSLTPMRIDAALVDQMGQVQIMENVLLMG